MFRRGVFVGYPGTGHHPILFLLLLLVLAAGITAIVLIVRDRHSMQRERVAPAPAVAHSGATRILDERFARGEIDDDEYRRRRAVLLSAP